ncbi:hypothetical protein CGCF415_v001363 [Colletotrichum fructicola]|uniref:BTB/POZ domain-containing protein n=2 Tax=Colletotrichum fructicola (strain Nara gc5) TaxID=1213859 RepID=L2FV49_COLFN|nr:hypothetical protein CGCFRS4_v000749 [Colletotrichum fructicola]KAF4915689.1 hypothetical protein CGCF415_v001363 [Colletotrichum fructicola]KAF4943048.1 hypothetical protein CGCF245_v000209 [Colletotrichum fructicola]
MEIDEDDSMASNDSGTSTTNNDDNIVANIAADGDVIMVVGPEKKEFRLHSFFLKTTSKVFKAMLGPNFAEGQQLNANGAQGNRTPVKIDLPEDDVKSMCFIFRAIHHHFDAFHNAKDIPFFEILVAADKYDLIHAIKHAFHHALAAAFGKEDTLKKMLGVKLWKFAMAAAFVKDTTAFKTATRIFVLHWEHDFLDFAKVYYFNEVFAFHVCAALERNRSDCRQKAMVELLFACKRESDRRRLEIKYKIGVSDPYHFIESSMEVDNDANMVGDDTNTINNIAPDGDVIMVIGPKKKEFRLHSQILKAASKVFNAMLGPKFAEGQQIVNKRSHNDPVKINLPEDDAYSMGVLFELIYYRYDVLSNADGITFFDVALAADKYDLIRAVKYPITEAMDGILFSYDERGEEESMWKLAIAASIFDYDPCFYKATEALILLSSDGYIRLADKWYTDQMFALRLCGQSQWNSFENCIFPNVKGISGLLEDQRTELRRLAMRKLMIVCARYNNEDND